MKRSMIFKPASGSKAFTAITFLTYLLLPAIGISQSANEHFKNALTEDKAEHYCNVIQHCNLAIQTNPANAEAFYLRGKARFVLKDFNGAIKDERKAAQLNLETENVYLISAFAKQELKQYKSAIADFSKAISINPENNIAYYHRGFANAKLNNKKQSRADFSRAIELGLGEPADHLFEIEPE